MVLEVIVVIKKILSCLFICWGLFSFVYALFQGYDSIPLILSTIIVRAFMLVLLLTVVYLLNYVNKLTIKLDVLNDQLSHYIQRLN